MSGQFVAVGHAGRIATSPDGITWTPRTSGTLSDLLCVCYSPTLNKWVAAGNSNVVLTSPNGTSWTVGTGAHAGNYEGVTWAQSLGLFVGAGNLGEISTSPDGTTWTRRLDLANNLAFRDVAWSGSLAVAWGTNTTGLPAVVYKSSDGLTWVDADPPTKSITGSGESVTYAGTLGLWVGVTNSDAYRSSDMTTQPYAKSDVGIGSNLRVVRWSPDLGQLLVGRTAGGLATSTNATIWTSRTSTFTASDHVDAAAWSPTLTLWAIGGSNGKLATSPDGATWTARTSSFGTTQINSLAWGALSGRGWVVGSATMN